MAHEIFGERFLGRNKPAWHKLGKVFTDPITAHAALVMAGMDYEIHKLPAWTTWQPDKSVPVKLIQSPQYTIVREPTPDDPEPRVLGSAGEGFELVQNRELAELIEPLTDEWNIETVAALKHGAITLFTLDVGQFDVAGDPCRQFLACVNGHDGTRSLQIIQTGVRTVCWNTLMAAESANSMHIKLRHTESVKREAGWYLDVISKLRQGMKRQQDDFNRMAVTEITDDDARKVIAAAYPEPKEPQKLRVTNAAESENMNKAAVMALLEGRNDAVGRYEVDRERMLGLQHAGFKSWEKLNAEFPKLAGTAWHAYNAVTEVATWREGPNADESVMVGIRSQEIQKAHTAALALVG